MCSVTFGQQIYAIRGGGGGGGGGGVFTAPCQQGCIVRTSLCASSSTENSVEQASLRAPHHARRGDTVQCAVITLCGKSWRIAIPVLLSLNSKKKKCATMTNCTQIIRQPSLQ